MNQRFFSLFRRVRCEPGTSWNDPKLLTKHTKDRNFAKRTFQVIQVSENFFYHILTNQLIKCRFPKKNRLGQQSFTTGHYLVLSKEEIFSVHVPYFYYHTWTPLWSPPSALPRSSSSSFFSSLFDEFRCLSDDMCSNLQPQTSSDNLH